MKKKMDLYLNLLIIVLEVIGLFLSFGLLKGKIFLYYTQDSNILLLIASILYVINYNKEEKRIISLLKYGGTLSVIVTFIVVIFVLGPTTDLTYKWLLLDSANLFYHTLCPIIALITFIFFDKVSIQGLKDNMYAMLFTIVYGIILVILNLIKVVDGPYPFLHLYTNPVYISVIWFIVLLGGAFILSMLLEMAKNKVQTK